MSWNGSGTFSALSAPTFPAVSGATISSTYFNATINDLVTGINAALAKNGENSATGPITFSAGAVGAPGINFGDATTGIYRSGADEVAFAVSGTQRGRFTSTGLVITGALSTTTFSATGLVSTAASATGGAGFRLPHGTAPTSPTNGDMWTTTSGLYVRINSATTGPFIGAGANTFTGKQTTAASATGGAGFNLPHGTAPTSPVNGDLWSTTAGVYFRANGATQGPFLGLTGGVSGTNLALGSTNYGGTDYNIYIGATAGVAAGSNVTGNIGIGHQALDSMTSNAAYNSAIGYQPGTAVTTGDYNVFIGYQPGLLIDTGNSNVFIGNSAGSAVAAGTTGSVIIGGNTGSGFTGAAVCVSTTKVFWHDATDFYAVHGTTASAANAFFDSGTNALKRSTSSLRYKRDVEPMQKQYAESLLQLQPIFYKSAIPTDKQEWSHYGFAAEELAEVEPRFVQYRPHDDDWTNPDENGERFPKPNCRLVPDGVAYDRMVVPLLMLVKDLSERLAKLEGV